MSMVPIMGAPTKKYWATLEWNYPEPRWRGDKEKGKLTYEFGSAKELIAFEEGLNIATGTRDLQIIRRWSD